VDLSTNTLWIAGIGLEAAIVWRAARTRLIRKYWLFYTYIGTVLAAETVRFCCYHLAPNSFQQLYWPAELVTIVASYAVVLEIFRQTLAHTRGVARIAQNLLSLVFGATLGYIAWLRPGSGSLPRLIAELGRDLRYVESALLVVVLWLLARYRIVMGRNLIGLIAGYSVWLGLNITNLALWYLPGHEQSFILRELLPLSYAVTLIIWCVSLWSVHPDPVPRVENEIEREYQTLALRTQVALARASVRLARGVRP
jgi:hypothetical protein